MRLIKYFIMNVDEAKLMIKNYQNLLDKGNKIALSQLYSLADVVVFEKEDSFFNEIKSEKLRLFLAIEDKKLVGFLTQDINCYKKWNKTTHVFKASFLSNKEVKLVDYSYEYKNKTSDKHPNYISPKVASERINFWNKNKLNWVSEMISANSVVRFFEISAASILYGGHNSLSLGINKESGFVDLLIENETGLYDTVKPVPPFK